MNWNPRDRAAFALAFGISFAIALPVMAQTVSGGVDFTPIANNMITTFAGILTAAATIISGFVVNFLSKKSGIQDAQLNALMQARLNDVMLKAIDFGEAWAKAQVADPNSPLKHVTLNNIVLDVMADYVVQAVPDTLRFFGLTREGVVTRLQARLAPYLATPVPDSGKLQTISMVGEHVLQPQV